LQEIQKALGVDSAQLFADVAAKPALRPEASGVPAPPQTLVGSPPSLETVRLVRVFSALRNRVLRDIVINLVEMLAAAEFEGDD
jgi:hypothetical protein